MQSESTIQACNLYVYGLFEIENSSWIIEIRNQHRQHPRHLDDSFGKYKHIIGRFKDVTIEIISLKMKETRLAKQGLFAFNSDNLGV
jgi:hypothetical protein